MTKFEIVILYTKFKLIYKHYYRHKVEECDKIGSNPNYNPKYFFIINLIVKEM